MSEDLINILLFIGGLILALILIYVLCRTFWTRTVLAILGALMSLILFFCADTLSCGIFYFITYFFLFGKSYGQKTGRVSVESRVNLDMRTATTTRKAITHTAGNIILSIILAFASVWISTMHVAAAIILPLLIILFKVLRIISHIKNREAEFNSYDDDGGPGSTTHTMHF